MKKLLLTLLSIITLSSCTQDKFEEIDARFDLLETELSDFKVTALQMILDNKKSIADLSDDINADIDAVYDAIQASDALNADARATLESMITLLQSEDDRLGDALDLLSQAQLDLDNLVKQDLVNQAAELNAFETRILSIEDNVELQVDALAAGLLDLFNQETTAVRTEIASLLNTLGFQTEVFEIIIQNTEIVNNTPETAVEPVVLTESQINRLDNFLSTPGLDLDSPFTDADGITWISNIDLNGDGRVDAADHFIEYMLTTD